jgi:hypothetical protein
MRKKELLLVIPLLAMLWIFPMIGAIGGGGQSKSDQAAQDHLSEVWLHVLGTNPFPPVKIFAAGLREDGYLAYIGGCKAALKNTDKGIEVFIDPTSTPDQVIFHATASKTYNLRLIGNAGMPRAPIEAEPCTTKGINSYYHQRTQVP